MSLGTQVRNRGMLMPSVTSYTLSFYAFPPFCLVFSVWKMNSGSNSDVPLHRHRHRHASFAGMPVSLACQFCWHASFAGMPVLLACQFCWHASFAGMPVLLACQFCWHASFAGMPVLLVHQFHWHASFAGADTNYTEKLRLIYPHYTNTHTDISSNFLPAETCKLFEQYFPKLTPITPTPIIPTGVKFPSH